MILIGEHEKFINADYIQEIYIQPQEEPLRYVVVVRLVGDITTFGRQARDAMTMPMALELRRRIVRAIARYKSSDKPEIQYVDIPTYQEMHPEEESETQ